MNELTTNSNTLYRVEIDTAIATAKQYPRDIKQCMNDLVDYATMDTETAQACWYSLPRGNKNIEGPSVRLAELAVMAFGNIRAGYRITEVDDKYVTAEGVAKDIQKNTEVMTQVKVRITDKHGKRYNDDMVQIAQLAAGSKAYRNAVFKIVPAAFINNALREAKLAVEKAANVNLGESVPKLFEAFEVYHVTRQDILTFLKVDSLKEITAMHVVTLQGYYQAIKEGTDPKTIFKGEKTSNDAPVLDISNLDDAPVTGRHVDEEA